MIKRLAIFLVVCGGFQISSANGLNAEMVLIPGGKYRPFTAKSERSKSSTGDLRPETDVGSFYLDRDLVTNEKFLSFVKSHPEWAKQNVRRLFADLHYLEHWKNGGKISTSQKRQPVTFVSWFAASAYCEAEGKRLPTTDEWEFALWDGGKNQDALKAKILAWYSKPNSEAISKIGGTKNSAGVNDLGLLVWEWTDDFNGFLVGSDTRDREDGKSNLFCGNGSQMGDASDYASFMRYSFRSSLQANYTTAILGFRCARGTK